MFFFNDTATTEIYTLSLHDALPISHTLVCPVRDHDSSSQLSFPSSPGLGIGLKLQTRFPVLTSKACTSPGRSEEHTSELQSRQYLVCRLLLEKKKKLQSTDQSVLHC